MARHSKSRSGTSSLPTALHPVCPASIHIPEVSGNGGPPAAIDGSSPIGFAVPDSSETQTMLRPDRGGVRPAGPQPSPPVATSSMSQLGFGPVINRASCLIHVATGSNDCNVGPRHKQRFGAGASDREDPDLHAGPGRNRPAGPE